MNDDSHTGPDHPDVTLALSERLPDGGMHFQSWTICACGLDRLRGILGPPHHESTHTAQTLRATGDAVLGVPGIAHLGEGL